MTLVELPLVLPPAVAGIGPIAAFGRFGLLGEELSALGIHVAFTRLAVVLAIAFVAGPFYVRTAIAAFEAVDPTLTAASRTLGAGPARTFARVALPLAAARLGCGAALSFARGLGEFGATIMFGSLQGVTQPSRSPCTSSSTSTSTPPSRSARRWSWRAPCCSSSSSSDTRGDAQPRAPASSSPVPARAEPRAAGGHSSPSSVPSQAGKSTVRGRSPGSCARNGA